MNEAVFNFWWNMMLAPMLMMSQMRDVVKPVPRARLILIQGGKPEISNASKDNFC
ncbi:hypothetical protein D3C78_945770 [compost metagenome]